MIRRPIVSSLCLLVWLFLVAAPRGAAVPPFSQSAGVTVSGTVVDAALAPLSGALITLSRQGVVTLRASSDAAGRFKFEHVVPGDYVVKATHANAPTLVRQIRISTGATMVNLPLVLAAPVALSEKVNGAPAGVAMPTAPPPPTSALPSQSAVVQAGAGGRGGGMMSQRFAADSFESIDLYQGSRDRYDGIEPNRFKTTRDHPLSTFGADVDTASYANVRRFLSNGQLPPADAVRVEDFLNYFKPEYALPTGRQPLALTTEVGDCPWAPDRKLVLVGARARLATPSTREGRNIVLLLDVSGSMAPMDRLPMIKTALRLFVDTLDPHDRLAIVTYAGSSGVALPSTPVRQRDVIQGAIAELRAGGSTNGAQGIVTAYRIARDAYIPGGVNRVMLATDGDFNVGVTGDNALVRLIERERESGVFLSIFGVGTGNLNDSALEKMANKGNGHYVYLDSLQEARRVLLHETDATLETVAKDVKFQVEFNQENVKAWKLIGYENRLMAARDFNDDRKDGGEMGAGHTVTVLYEIVPSDEASDDSSRLLTVKARYKEPEGEESALIEKTVRPGGRVRYLPFMSAVAEFALILRDGANGMNRWDSLSRRISAAYADQSLASDRAGLIELVDTAKGLSRLQRR